MNKNEKFESWWDIVGTPDDATAKHIARLSWDAALRLQPDFSQSETPASEIYKSQLFPLNERLEMADGAVAFRDKVIENLRRQDERRVTRGLSDEDIDTLVEAMPGGVAGFMKGWGWRNFAHAVEAEVLLGFPAPSAQDPEFLSAYEREFQDTMTEGSLMHAAADECMSPEQRDLFDMLGRCDSDVYARLLRCTVKRLGSLSDEVLK